MAIYIEEFTLTFEMLQKIMDLPEVGNMSSTNSANPLACSAGLAVIEEIEKKKLSNNAKIKGELLHKNLLKISQKFPNLINIYGKGLIAAVVFKKDHKNINK